MFTFGLMSDYVIRQTLNRKSCAFFFFFIFCVERKSSSNSDWSTNERGTSSKDFMSPFSIHKRANILFYRLSTCKTLCANLSKSGQRFFYPAQISFYFSYRMFCDHHKDIGHKESSQTQFGSCQNMKIGTLKIKRLWNPAKKSDTKDICRDAARIHSPDSTSATPLGVVLILRSAYLFIC